MSKENVEIVRESLAAFDRGDLDGFIAFFHPDVEVDWSGSRAPFSGTYGGHEGLLSFWTSVWEAWDEFNPQIEEGIDCGPERTITVILVQARGKTSGIEIAARGAVLWTLRDGRISEAKLFQGREQALEAVGAGGS